jgi:hypothetical protein
MVADDQSQLPFDPDARTGSLNPKILHDRIVQLTNKNLRHETDVMLSALLNVPRSKLQRSLPPGKRSDDNPDLMRKRAVLTSRTTTRGRALRWRWWAFVLIALTAVGLTNCAWQVTPPATVIEPTTVYLTQYGLHTRLALPAADEGLIEYGFGEWHYYGLEERSWQSGGRAIFGLGTAARSRHRLATGGEAMKSWKTFNGDQTAVIVVETDAATRLRDRLETSWNDVREHAVQRKWDGVWVAPTPEARYHLFRNSNHATAQWLRELDCDVRGIPITADFTVENAR